MLSCCKSSKIIVPVIALLVLLVTFSACNKYIPILEELSRRECVTHADCKQKFPNQSRKHHCEVKIYECVYNCAPTRESVWIDRQHPIIRETIYNTHNFWIKSHDALKTVKKACIGGITVISGYITIVVVYVGGVMGSIYNYIKKIKAASIFTIICLLTLAPGVLALFLNMIQSILPESYVRIVVKWLLKRVTVCIAMLNTLLPEEEEEKTQNERDMDGEQNEGQIIPGDVDHGGEQHHDTNEENDKDNDADPAISSITDDTQCDDEKKEIYNLSIDDDESCLKLQYDIENYISDQKKKNKKNKHDINPLILKKLKIFHDNKAKSVVNWDNVLKKNYHESLVEKLKNVFNGNDDYKDNTIDTERVIHELLFNVIYESFDLIHGIHHKMKTECIHSNTIDILMLNIKTFYKLMDENRIKNRIPSIHHFINNNLIEVIYQNVNKAYLNIMKKNIDDNMKDDIRSFMVECCSLIWSLLNFRYRIHPETFIFGDKEYDQDKHQRDGICNGNHVKYCVFPGIIDDKTSNITKIWVLCDNTDDI